MTELIICGLSMEMEMAKEMGTVGKCISCHRFNCFDGVPSCEKKGILDNEKEDCDDWIVNHR